MEASSWPKGVQVIQFPQRVDERGVLTFGEGSLQIPFAVQRIFWITDVPAGQMRGGHAHRTCHEVVVAIGGSFEIEVSDARVSRVFCLSDPSKGLLIPAGVWCELRHFAPGTVCLVAASQAYDAQGYIHDHAAWLEEQRRNSQ